MAAVAAPPQAKKARAAARSWKSLLTQDLGPRPRGNLHSMFAHGFGPDRAPGAGSAVGVGAPQDGAPQAGPADFYTLRLEHRTGGPLAQFRGEERILLFRSDRRGAIAKIIYSSELPEGRGAPASPTPSAAQAKIHVLDVKAPYRGCDLGGLLFSEAITSLRSRYCDDDEEEPEGGEGTSECHSCGAADGQGDKQYKYKQMYDVECVLDAEEDAARSGKLVAFYESLGCRVNKHAKVQYINNNDSETYRKIPMQIDLHPAKVNTAEHRERARLRRKGLSDLTTTKRGAFLPVKLVGPMGKLRVLSPNRQDVLKLDWLIAETPDGLQFCTTHGHFLVAPASADGGVTVLSPGDPDREDDYGATTDATKLRECSHFVPYPISDDDLEGGDGDGSQGKSLWVLRTAHGYFLAADSVSQTLSCTKIPSFWQANGGNLSLACTSDTPPRRHHYRKSWKFQTYDYVASMRARFLKFSLGRATLREALGLIHAFPAHPFQVWTPIDSDAEFSPDSAPSLRTLCFVMAETARKEGFPDWLQLVALFHELGEAVKILDPSRTGEMAEIMYDWTISSRSRVVGCKVPQRATFREFRHLNMDEDDIRYNSDTGTYQPKCGLENVSLMWSGCEYMYYLLKRNSSLPSEALAAIRLFLLGDWHEHGEYSSLADRNDEDMLPFVQEFDALRRRVRLECVDRGNLTDEQCSHLWDSHYGDLAAKYACDHVLDW